MEKLFGLISIDVTDVIKTVRERDMLMDGLLNLIIFFREAKRHGQLPTGFVRGSFSPEIRAVRKYAGEILTENIELKAKIAELEKETPTDKDSVFSEEDMFNCFKESRLTHPMIGFKHKNFKEYLDSLEIIKNSHANPS